VAAKTSERESNGENDVSVVGGGLAGLISSFLLAREGWSVSLFEKKQYPFHRVCGEYVSNETLPFLQSNGLFPEEFHPEKISRFQLTSVNGKSAELSLGLGGFGISRYSFDNFLYKKAIEAGVNVHCDTSVEDITFKDDDFILKTSGKEYRSRLVIGAHGKRSKLDHTFNRQFVRRRSPYVGVKYHIRVDHEPGLIALHNFKDGYCGISNVEDGKTNLCYLTHRNNMKRFGNVREMEEAVLFGNPFLRSIFQRAEFLPDKPEVINEISFATKDPVEHHILMAGDAAGMIAPLCGNGMAMAIHSAKIAAEWGNKFLRKGISREVMEEAYASEWAREFSVRLWAGRRAQALFGSEGASNLAVNLARYVKPVAKFLVERTHGRPF
jgi:flavin-dependent dehydrogenase